VSIIERVSDPERILDRESFWIKKLGTLSPPGLNVQKDVFLRPSLPLVLPFHPSLHQLSHSISRVLSSHGVTLRVFPAPRKHRSLQALIAKTKFTESPSSSTS
jgi:hypothetical protein